MASHKYILYILTILLLVSSSHISASNHIKRINADIEPIMTTTKQFITPVFLALSLGSPDSSLAQSQVTPISPIDSSIIGSWWLLLGLFAILLILTAVIILYRETNLKHVKKKLERMVKDRTKELQKQAEFLKQANEEITATSEALTRQNKELQRMNEEFILQQNELEHQKNALANLAWELQEKNEEITVQRNEIEVQKDLLTQQKKEITDSIRYAQRIQEAVLPSEEQISDIFTDYFILNQPKSIVSGDFYWVSRIGRFRVAAVADCTGHGVPGGFMSMLGTLMLKEVVSLRTVHNPSMSLNLLRQNIINVLHQRGEITDSGDGMDLSLCIIDDQNQRLHYSGANSSIMVVEPDANNQLTIKNIRSDRMPISFHTQMKPFTTTSIDMVKGSRLYLYTDGLIDQFGGENGRKFQLKRFKEYIDHNYHRSLNEQGEHLEQIFNEWKATSFQVDDVLVFGIQL